MNSFDSFTLAPMSAGDIIDRAVRLYRRNFLALLRIVIGPSLIAYAGSVLMSVGWRNLNLYRGDARIAITVLMVLCGLSLLVIGKAAFYAFLGGSARALVGHFFDGHPILARDVYRAVRERAWSLIGATMLMGLLILVIVVVAYFFLAIVAALVFAVVMAALMKGAPAWVQTVVTIGAGLVVVISLAAAALLVYSRVVYVPQILMVENKGVFNSISRSFELAGGQLRRIAALFLFWVIVGWAVLWLLFFPLESFAYWMGVDITPFNTNAPVWYSLAQQTVAQVSEILLMPIAMLGFTLLYLDSRVRKEGYDVELLANRTLAQPPAPAPVYTGSAPRSFGIQPRPPLEDGSFRTSILGLNDYGSMEGNPASPDVAADLPAQAQEADPAIAPVASESVGEGYPHTAAVPTDDETPPSAAPLSGGAETARGDVIAESARKSCRWCGAEATVEDRFCRVCGSVF
jgi:hypothetical protein